jgi:hypothetical protein
VDPAAAPASLSGRRALSGGHNNSRRDTRNKFARQISGNSVYKNQTINLIQSWAIRDHAVTGPRSRRHQRPRPPDDPCVPSRDVLKTATPRSGDVLIVTMPSARRQAPGKHRVRRRWGDGRSLGSRVMGVQPGDSPVRRRRPNGPPCRHYASCRVGGAAAEPGLASFARRWV